MTKSALKKGGGGGGCMILYKIMFNIELTEWLIASLIEWSVGWLIDFTFSIDVSARPQ